jgi:hypothetical protein
MVSKAKNVATQINTEYQNERYRTQVMTIVLNLLFLLVFFIFSISRCLLTYLDRLMSNFCLLGNFESHINQTLLVLPSGMSAL